MPQVTVPPRVFHRLFLECHDDSGGCRFKIRVSPDPGQVARQAEFAPIIACSTLDELASCLKTLGADGVSRFVGEGMDGLPLFNYAMCTVDEVIAFLRTHPPLQFRAATLIASDTSVDEMRHRMQHIELMFKQSGA